jgi:hypothetical protein
MPEPLVIQENTIEPAKGKEKNIDAAVTHW